MKNIDQKLEKLKKESEKLSPEARHTISKLIELAKSYKNFVDSVEKSSQDKDE